jgi:preprotein translocase SecF subunit
MYRIIQTRKIWLSLSAILAAIGILSLLIWGLKFSIDFTGGSLIELEFNQNRPSTQAITDKLSDLKLDSLNIQPIGDKGILVRTVTLTEDTHQEILKKINELFSGQSSTTTSTSTSNTLSDDQQKKLKAALGIVGTGTESMKIEVTGGDVDQLLGTTKTQTQENKDKYFVEQRFDSVGPTIGKELQYKTIYAIIIVLIAIIIYIAYVFRKVSQPVESWKYGVAATIALFHDILIVIGIYSILSHFFGLQVDSLIVTAMLTILGFSVHDTIVTFDRIRENLHRHQEETFESIINRSINETITRSLNTTLTVLFVLLATYIFGGESIKHFILTLLMGFTIGTYSSIFIASPILLYFYKLKKL